jgi:hypothetical protein
VKPLPLRDLEDLVERLEAMVDEAREIPLTDGIRMDRSELEDVVRQMRRALAELEGVDAPAAEPPRFGDAGLFSGPSVVDER